MTNKLDKLDRRLLYELDGNSRRTTSELARIVKQGRDRVDYRLERLKDSGILKRCSVTINPYKLGLTLYKTYLKLDKREIAYEKILKFLDQHPKVYWIADCDGSWDLIFSTFSRSAYEFYKVQREITGKFAQLIISSEIYTLVNVEMHRKGYLVNKGSKSFNIGGKPDSCALTQFEWDLLKLLSQDARKSLVELSSALRTTEAIVGYAIEKLEKAGIIAGYRAELELSKMDMLFFKAQIYLLNTTSDLLKRLQEYCLHNPNITYFIEQLGECEIEIELEVESYQQYTQILNGLRAAFVGEIRNIETILINNSWFKWVPLE